MKCRIMIEDENGLFQTELEKDKSVTEVIQNLRNLCNMKKVGTYIILTDCANYNGCICSVHGNGEKLAGQYDTLTHVMADNYPEILLRVMAAWDRRSKHE